MHHSFRGCSEVQGFRGLEGSEVQRFRCRVQSADVQRCRCAEGQRCRYAEEVSADVQSCRAAELQRRCRVRCRGGAQDVQSCREVVQSCCRGAEVQQRFSRSGSEVLHHCRCVAEVQMCRVLAEVVQRLCSAEVQMCRGVEV